MLGPEARAAVGGDAHVVVRGRREQVVGAANRPSAMRSTHTMNAGPNAVRVSGVGQMKSAMAVAPASTTRSLIQPMRLACSIRSACEKPRSRLMWARTSSALKTTALRSGARQRASVVFPAPGSP